MQTSEGTHNRKLECQNLPFKGDVCGGKGGGMGGGYGKRMEFFSNSSAEGMHIFSRKVFIYMCKLELSTSILGLPMLRSSVVNIKYFLLKFLITDFWPFLGRSSHMIHDHSVRLFYSRKFASISCFSPTIRVILLGQSQVCFANITTVALQSKPSRR